MLASLKSSNAESNLAKFEKENKTLIDKFSALALECEEISYEDNPSKKKRNSLLDRCEKLKADSKKLESKVQKLNDESISSKQETVLKSIRLLERRAGKMKTAITSEKIEKEEIRQARECGEVSDESDEDADKEVEGGSKEAAEKEMAEENGHVSTDEDTGSDEDDAKKDTEENDLDNAVSEAKNVLHEAICEFEAEEPDDLGFKTGELLTVVEVRNDGWWLAENEDGKRGMVPSTYLKVHTDASDDESEGNEPSSDPEPDPEPVPEPKTSKRGSMLWSSLRNVVREASATDVLTALGALPSGFRHSTLGTSLADGDKYTCKSHLRPKLSKSALGFSDLFWDPNTGQIRARACRILRLVTLVRCTNIPLPGAGVEVLSRHVRFCLFDGMTVPPTSSVIEEAECFVRSSGSNDSNMSILFELCVSYARPSTGEKGELSCGWVSLRLLDDSGLPIPNRYKELYVNGGTPFEKGVEVDSSVGRREANGSLRSMISRNRQPMFFVKIMAPSREQKEQLDLLPDVIVNNMQALPFLCFYRQILADALLRDRIRAESSEKIHAPLLATFPSAIDQPDVVDMLRVAWNERQRTEKRVNKKDREMRKQTFRKVFMETVYVILCHTDKLPPYKFADIQVSQRRKEVIDEVMSKWKEFGTLAILLAPGSTHKPFTTNELSLDILQSECISA